MLNLLKTLPPVYTYRTQKKAKISEISDFHGGGLKGKVPNTLTHLRQFEKLDR